MSSISDLKAQLFIMSSGVRAVLSIRLMQSRLAAKSTFSGRFSAEPLVAALVKQFSSNIIASPMDFANVSL